MNSLFSICLKTNPVKRSKIKRVYARLNKTDNISYSLAHGQMSLNDLQAILDSQNPKNTVDQKWSKNASKELKKDIAIVLSDEGSIAYLINKDPAYDFNDISFVQHEMLGNHYIPKIIDLTNTVIPKSISYVETADEMIAKVQNLGSEYKSYDIYTGSFFGTSKSQRSTLPEAIYCQKQLGWTDEELFLFIKESKIKPGDVIPSQKESSKLKQKMKYVLKGLITEEELTFLQEQLDLLYYTIEGRFPETQDITALIQNSHMEQKEAIIRAFQELDSDSEAVIIPAYIEDFRADFEDFKLSNETGNNPDMYLHVATTYWNQALIHNQIPLLYEELKNIQKQGFNVITYGHNKDTNIPSIKIYYKYEKEVFENIDFSIFTQGEKA